MSAERYLEVAGARLRYRDEGHGAAIVLIHGWTLDLDMWGPQVDALQGRFRLVRFDRRGFGLSSGAPDVTLDAGDASALCRRLGIQRAVFVGMSQGARVLEGLILQSPGLVAGLVFDGAPDMRPGAPLTQNDVPFEQYAEVARVEGLQEFRKAWADSPLSRLVTNDPRARALLQSMLDRYPGTDLFRPETASSAGVAPWESIRVPTLVLNGELDLQSRLQAGDLLASRIPRARRVLVPRAGHLPNIDNSVGYNRILLEFVESVNRPPRVAPRF